MARGTTLKELLEQLRAECRLSTAPAQGTGNLDNLQQLIRRTYETLWDEYDWPFLRIRREAAGKVLEAGQRYYDFPEAVGFETVDELWHKDGDRWHRLEYGISPEHYSAYDSDTNVRSSLPMRWDVLDGAQFEIWPLPAENCGEIRFAGRRKFVPLVSPSDRAELDDRLIVLFAASEYLAAGNQKDAQAKVELAQRRLRHLRARFSSKRDLSFAPSQQGHQSIRIRVVSGG